MPSDAPVIPVQDLVHKGARGVTAKDGQRKAESFIERASLVRVNGISRANAHNRALVQKYFYDESRKGHWDQDVANTLRDTSAAPVLTPKLQAEIADRMVAQNIARILNAPVGGPNDGFKRLNVIGYFLAVAAAHETDANPTPEVLAARAVRDAVAERMHKATPEMSLARATSFLNDRGKALANSTQGWENELADLRKQGWFKEFPALAKSTGTGDSVSADPPSQTGGRYQHDANSSAPGFSNEMHVQAMRAAAIADREARYRDEQHRIIERVRIAARDAVNGVHSATAGAFTVSV